MKLGYARTLLLIVERVRHACVGSGHAIQRLHCKVRDAHRGKT